MPLQKNNSVMYGTRGLFNKQVVFKSRYGKPYVAGLRVLCVLPTRVINLVTLQERLYNNASCNFALQFENYYDDSQKEFKKIFLKNM